MSVFSFLCCSFITLMIAAISGCGSLQEPDTAKNQQPAMENCNWTRQRGIAELLRSDGNTAHFTFFPGDVQFQAPAKGREWQPGDEFKVLLAIPDSPDCAAPRAVTLEPLEPDT